MAIVSYGHDRLYYACTKFRFPVKFGPRVLNFTTDFPLYKNSNAHKLWSYIKSKQQVVIDTLHNCVNGNKFQESEKTRLRNVIAACHDPAYNNLLR